MSKSRMLFLLIITIVIAALCWITYAGGRGDLAIYYVIGLVLLIILEIVRMITQKKGQ